MSWTRARFGSIAVFGSFVVSASVLGGPSQPHLVAQPRLEEIAPIVEDVEVKKGDPFLEVFITGTGHLNCYDSREYQVEVGKTSTRIIPRLKRTTNKPCKMELKTFRDKAADLDPYNPASQNIEVLGFRGIHRLTVPAAINPTPTPSPNPSPNP